MSAFFVGSFFFWSILMINPNGFENILSIEKQSLSNIIDNQLVGGIVQSNNIVNDYHSALQFCGIDILIQSVVSGSKIATQFALDMDEGLPFASLLSVIVFAGTGSILYLILGIIFKKLIFIFSSSFTLG
ncbi:MAG: hypothetical protein EZS28_056474, partial [Streblomastix strix]